MNDFEPSVVKFRIGNYRYPVTVTPTTNGKLELKFRFNRPLIDEIKACMSGARWHPDKVCWTVDSSQRNLFVMQLLAEKNPYAPYDLPIVDFKPRRYWCYQHQNLMSAFEIARRQCIVAAEMGTGKTLATEEAMEASGHDDWYWAGPKSALYSVKLEFQQWKICDLCGLPRYTITLPDKTIPGHNQNDHPWLTSKCVQPRFFTYEALKKLVEEWPADKDPPRGLVLDESSRCKNPTAQRSQAAHALATAMRQRWGREAWIIEMSGSPAPKSPLDWWWQCEIACPGFLKEGTYQKFQQRLAVIEQRENMITGGVYPHLVCWRDSTNRCVKCGTMKGDVKHDLASGGHTFEPCEDEVSKLYRRMNGLVLVMFKKDCLDLPEKQYKLIQLKPPSEMVRAAEMINERSPSAIQALTLLRELSDGFQYRETEVGTETCPICGGTRERDQVVDLDDPNNPLDALSIEYGKRVVYDEAGVPTITDKLLRLGKTKVACEACDATGEIARLARTTVEVKSPKEDALKDIIDEHEEVGRIVVYGGFTGTIDKLVKLVKRCGWEYIRVDGRGWDCSLKERDPVQMLQTFQRNKSIERLAFIGQPGAAGMGLNLTASPSVVYYSNDFNAESRIQSEDRIHRPGMDVNRGATIYDILLLPSDMLVLNNLKRKRRLQDLSLGQMRDEIKAIKWSDIRAV